MEVSGFFSEKKSSTFWQKKKQNNFSKEVKQVFLVLPLNSKKKQTTPRFCAEKNFDLSSRPRPGRRKSNSMTPMTSWTDKLLSCSPHKRAGQTPHGLES